MNADKRRWMLPGAIGLVLILSGCADETSSPGPANQDPMANELPSYYGTLEPFVESAVYFVVTDRFVNGDESNDHRDQGGKHPTFDIPLPECDGVAANIGYLGGDFAGLAAHAGYIAEMGFGAVWITPVVDNPNQAFTGGDEIGCDSILTDRGKTGYHGYWGMNFHRLDEHLPSPAMGFQGLDRALEAHGLELVLDVVGNHSSPGWTMPEKQPGFGQVFSADGELMADHSNLPPAELDPESNPLHAWYNTEPGLAQLADFNTDNPEVVDYLVDACLQWIEQGADAFRIDTIPWAPHRFWKEFADRIRAEHPGFFMFAEAFDYDPAKIAEHTRPENGGVSVLDFPMRRAMQKVFEDPGSDYAQLSDALMLDDAPYANVYELATFYDNHDMARLDADDDGFIDAHNWLFTSRGFPVVYYGSETGFMRGRAEHAGNRNYFGSEGIEAARAHPIRESLIRIARARADSIALQRGVQVMLELSGRRAAFYRVYQHEGMHQIALVLLNKGDRPERFEISRGLQPGAWRSALDDAVVEIEDGQPLLREVPPHGAAVLILDAPVKNPELVAMLR
ncbi:MAG: alpha-amylase family glycosyl hydrolase [Wenzhouxiangellaceae bacterium]|nr:alpha-amylase family glycosyl hydrolase [Wenzhouxiangellaceae bacterium]